METDTRLAQPQTLARPWIRVTLKSCIYQGSGAVPTYSMWTISGGTPRIWIATADGVGSGDSFLYAAGSHVHTNQGFGALGIYRLRFAATAYRGPGQSNPTAESGVYAVTFAVGPVANWQAAYFTGSELENPIVCGLAADPDADGMNNLLEFAFGFDPRNGRRLPVSNGLGLPVFSIETEGGITYQVLEFPRRRAESLTDPTVYVAEFSDLKNSGGWHSAATETAADFTGKQAGLNAVWEKVRARRALPLGEEAAGFGRVRLTHGG